MTDLYPEIDPYAHGMLGLSDGDLLYWEACGNPDGKPALVLHGGPGSGCTPWHRRLFDPATYGFSCSINGTAGAADPTRGRRGPICRPTRPTI
jgi:proline iminopeptidase